MLVIFGVIFFFLGVMSVRHQGSYGVLVGGLIMIAFSAWWIAGFIRTSTRKREELADLLVPLDQELGIGFGWRTPAVQLATVRHPRIQ